MFKKLLLAFALFIFSASGTFADDLSGMTPTVKIRSYKKLFTDQVVGFSTGSGTVVSTNGLIITNHHVIYNESEEQPFDAFEVCITTDVSEEPTCKYMAQLVAHDKDLDIAILKMLPEDVFGEPVGRLNYLTYKNGTAPSEGSKVEVYGYPGSGGDTITITAGQVSGFETYNDYSYFKTDTDFDHGSSGGTATDGQGNFIGIPTYIRSYAENVGFFLDIREALPWIAENIDKSPKVRSKAEKILKRVVARVTKANDDKHYVRSDYPAADVRLPEGWHFFRIEDNNFIAEQKTLREGVNYLMTFEPYPFEVDEGFMKELDEQFQKLKQRFPDFKKEEYELAGKSGFRYTHTGFDSYRVSIVIPYGYALMSLNYTLDLEEDLRAKQEKAIEEALGMIQITDEIGLDPGLPRRVSFLDPPFSIEMFEDFSMQKNPSDQPISLLATGNQQDNYDGEINVFYRYTPKDERTLSSEDSLEQETKYFSSSQKLIASNDAVVLDGLEGFMYIFEYSGDEVDELNKRLVIKLREGEYTFTIQYDDLTDQFDANLPVIQKILDSFDYRGETEREGVTDYGTLAPEFSDIQNHHYASEILNLKDKGVLFDSGNTKFRPEDNATRAWALSLILESKNQLEIEKELGEEVDFKQYTRRSSDVTLPFRDVRQGDWYYKYVAHGFNEGYVSGFSRGSRFAPGGDITLAEMLKWMLEAYEIPVWQGDSSAWYKPYIGKGFEIGLEPYGVFDPREKLSRSEVAYMVNLMFEWAKRRAFNL